MKILFATDQYLPTPGGISVVIERLAHALTERGHNVSIIAPSTSWKFKKEKRDGIIVFRIPSVLIHKAKQIRYSPKFLHKKNITKVIDSFKPDIIHVQTSDAIVATTVGIARKRNIPLIATCHIMPQNISGSLPFLPSKIGKMVGNIYMKQMIQVFNKVDYVTAPTQTGIAILKANSLKVPTAVISNGIDLQRFAQHSALEKKKVIKKYHLPAIPIVLYVGRLDKEKKIAVLIKALPSLKKEFAFHVVVAGTGVQLENLQNMAKKLRVDDNVSFPGFVDDADLATLYSLAAVFVMPSTAELQSLVTMEAMAVGLPIIGARAGAIPYLVKTNKNGFLFFPDSVKDLVKKLQILLEDEKLRKRMGSQSLAFIKEHDMQHIVTQLEALYTSVLNEKKHYQQLLNPLYLKSEVI